MTAKSSSKRAAAEPRRANKPLMEKRRRARINQSLAALKALILDTTSKNQHQDSANKHSKLEKADILELTVRHFQRHRNLDAPGVHQYRAGYSDCVKEVQRYLDTPDVHTMTMVDSGVKQRLIRHLDNCVSEIDTDLKPPAITEDRLQPPPDSSTAEEVNNEIVQYESDAPRKLLRRCDVSSSSASGGSFVFVLPSHYLQFASALGINLRPQPDDEERRRVEKEEEAEEEEEEEKDEEKSAAEKPLDFSKNNEAHDMWRPW